MKAAYISALIALALFFGRSLSAADGQVVTSRNVGTQANSLSSVAVAADNEVWAVGWAFQQAAGAYRTLVEHWNGSSWSIVRSPNATKGYNLLNGVAVVAANDAWAVGQAANGNT
ncbi:MAG: hypothetical protein ABR514_11375 [Chthoniobacterales bacterium]